MERIRYSSALSLSGWWLLIGLAASACDAIREERAPLTIFGPVEDAVFDSDSTFAIRWKPASWARSYRVEVSDTPDFSNLIETHRTGGTTLVEAGPLPKGTYYWRIVAFELKDDIGTASPGIRVIIEDRRYFSVTAEYAFTFESDDLAGAQLVDVASSDSGGLPARLEQLGILNAEVRHIEPTRVTLMLRAPESVTLRDIGTLALLLTATPDAPELVAILDTPPGMRSAEMRLPHVGAVRLQGIPQALLRITPASDVPSGSYRLVTSVQGEVMAVVP